MQEGGQISVGKLLLGRHGKWVGNSEGVVKEGVGKNAELGCFRKGRGEVK